MKKYLALIFVISILITAYYNEVDNSLTEEDMRYVPMYLADVVPLTKKPTYREELSFITSVQKSVLDIAPRKNGLPFNQKRELKEIYVEKTGSCSEKSRVVEKLLRYSGFKTRHVSIYSKFETGSAILSLMTPRTPSHAVTEVLTKKGWLIVDAFEPWVSVDMDGMPLSTREIQDIQESTGSLLEMKWNNGIPHDIYSHPFTFVFGLYSRHGKFYPPYNFIPDISFFKIWI